MINGNFELTNAWILFIKANSAFNRANKLLIIKICEWPVFSYFEKMEKWCKKTIDFFLRQDAWIFWVVMLVVSLMKTILEPPHSWTQYAFYAFLFTVAFFPLLLFSWQKPILKKRLSWLKYIILWLAAFIIYPFILVIIEQNADWRFPFETASANYLFLTMALVLLGLEVSIELNQYLRQKLPTVHWARNITLEKAILSIIFLWALILSMMAASNLEQFYHEHPIDPTINLLTVLKNFGEFLGILLQLFIAYLAGYFFYFINHRLLVPHFLKARGMLIYLVSVAGVIAIFYPLLAQFLLLLPLSQNVISLLPSENTMVFDSINLAIPLAIMAFSLPLIFMAQWFQQNNQIVSLEKQQVQTELDLLKQQINPHFFFNTLNNLYSLSLKKSEKTPEVILQLSELMRYVIYEGKAEKTLLTAEMKYLKDYIKLQELRLHKKLDLQIEENIGDKSLQIPPLLFIVLVENAFKHGIEPAEKACFLQLRLQGESDHILFVCENSVETASEKSVGIGLENLKRRLDLCFPQSHKLQLEKEKDRFKAILEIHL